jgi:hypothetical protein
VYYNGEFVGPTTSFERKKGSSSDDADLPKKN